MNKTSFIPAVLAGATVALVAQAMPAAALSLDLRTFDGQFDASNVSVNLFDGGNGNVTFEINNVGPTLSSITKVYFGTQAAFTSAFAFTSLENGSGMNFSPGATPNNPGGGIQWDAGFTTGANPPAGWNKNGIEVNDGTLKVNFSLINGATFDNVSAGFQNGTFAVAMHVQSIGGDNGPSAWVGSHNVTPNDVPEPLTLLGTAAALAFGGLFQLERSKRRQQEVAANA